MRSPLSGLDAFVLSFAFCASFSICVLIILLARRFPILSGRSGDLAAVQAMHTSLTPRIGGVGIFVSLALALFFIAPPSMKPYLHFMGAASIIFIVGLIEDLGIGASPRVRLLAAFTSSSVAIYLLQFWMPRLGAPFFDPLMLLPFIGVPVTLIFTTGLANGFNLVDGLNGLAGITAMACALALAFIAYVAGVDQIVLLSLMLASAILGYLILNYPGGVIFLGDAGAYTIGFVLSWLGIILMIKVPSVSPWAVFLTMFWPIADTLLAIFRRVTSKKSAMKPDRLHFHQLVLRALEIHVWGRNRRRLTNPLATLILTPFLIAPPLLGVLFWNNTLAAFFAFALSGIVFTSSYFIIFSILRTLPRAEPNR